VGNLGTGGTVSSAGNILTSANVSATGNVIAANFIGNVSGNISAPGANTEVIFNDNSTTGATTGFTFDKTSNTVTVGANVNAQSFNGNVFATSVSASGTVTAASTVGGIITGSSASVTGDITGGNLFTAGNVSATGNALANILVTQLGGIDSPAANLFINYSQNDVNTGVYADNGDIVFFVDAGTGTASFGNASQTVNSVVSFNATNSVLMPVGNTAQRPVGSTGQLRFNSTVNSLELFDNTQWVQVGVPEFTLITDQQFNGDGSTLVFTLGANATTAGTIVSINGVQQIPTTAYAVSGTTLTFTEAPAPGDLIDVRNLTTTTSVTQISNSSGNAVISVSEISNVVLVTGRLSGVGNALTIQGDLTVTGNATITGNVATNSINNGNSRVEIPTINGNVNIDVGVTNNMSVFAADGVYVTGNVSVTGDVVAQNVNSLSDATLKTNIQPISGIESVLFGLKGVEYDWKNGTGHSYGFLAQEVEQVLPGAVKTGPDGLKSVNYQMIIPFLVETIKQMGEEIRDLKHTVKSRGKKK
jgi:hypothetical protein